MKELFVVLPLFGCADMVPDQLAVGGYHLCYRTGYDVACRMIDNVEEIGETGVPEGLKFTEIVSGVKWTCGLDSEGMAHCWGDEVVTAVEETTPNVHFVRLGADVDSPCGIDSEGSAWCWGPDWEGETGYHAGKFEAIDGSTGKVCGLTQEHHVECWGLEYPGNPPQEAVFSSFDMSCHAGCGIDEQGNATCWGSDEFGQISVPVGIRFRQIAMGGQHGCGLTVDGQAVCWGSNRFGQLDAIEGPFTEIGSGMRASCGIRTDGEVVCWGCIDDSFCDAR